MNTRTKAVRAGIALALAGGLSFFGPATAALAVEQSEVDAASSQLASLGQQLEQIQAQLQSATEAIEQTSYDVESKQAQIELTEADLAEKRGELTDLLHSDYKQGQTTVLDFVLGSTSIDDLVSRLTYMDKVTKKQASIIDGVKATEQQLKDEQAELEGKQADQQQKLDDLQAQANDFNARVAEASNYYNSLDSQLQAEVAAKATDNASVSAAVEVVERANSAGTTDLAQVGSGTSSGSNSGGAASAPSQAEDTKTDESAGNNNQVEEAPAAPSTPSTPSQPSQPAQSETKPATSVAGGLGVSTALAAAEAHCPYVYGATGPSSFDCSGLVCYSYGYGRGRTTYQMISSLKATGDWKTDISQLNYGDLVFTSEGHVGIYLGNNTMVHAPQPGSYVCTTTLWSFIGGGPY